MASKKPKAGHQSLPAAPLEEVSESTLLLRYGAHLYDEYARQPDTAASRCCLRLQRFGDYLEHFGFSPEREKQPQSPSPPQPAAPPATKNATAAGLWTEAVPSAGWAMPAAERAEADAMCNRIVAAGTEGVASAFPAAAVPAAGSSPGGAKKPTAGPTVASVAAALTKAYARVSWRQTQWQCDLKKTRVIFAWLCQHLTTIYLREPPHVAAAAAEGKTAAPAASRKKNGKATAAAAVAADDAAAPPPPPDPLQAALDARGCTPAVAARLFQAMLTQCQLSCDVVEGVLKGHSPTEAVPWAWNRVTIGGRQYLVDVAAAVFAGCLRERAGGDESHAPGEQSGAGAKTGLPSPRATVSPSKAKDGKRGAKGGAAEADAAAARDAMAAASPLPQLSLTQGPRWAAVKTASPAALGRADFYMFANPSELIYTHLPCEESATLLQAPPTRAAWEVAPRLSDGFFAFPVRLRSHSRSCLFSVRATPFYITVVNDHPDTTELCAVVYPCSLEELPERLCDDGVGGAAASVAPLGPQWVWHQRCEATGEETFTFMVPEGGFYSVVLGARAIRADPYTCQLATTADGGFTPIVRYQAKVSFAPIASSMLPRQHLSPSVVRLMRPLSQQLPAGTHAFAVMPTCSNVLAVAVVACTNTSNTSRTAASPPQPQPQQQPRRRLICFLAFDPLNAVYEGSAELKVGESAEVWVRYAAPDHNGLTLREKVVNDEAERAARAPPAPPPPAVTAPPSSKGTGSRAGGRKAVEPPAGPTAQQREAEQLSRRVAVGEVFIPAVSGLEVRKIASAEAPSIVQPQPTVAEERAATLVRLVGVTSRLYEKAVHVGTIAAGPVGTFFDAKQNDPLLD